MIRKLFILFIFTSTICFTEEPRLISIGCGIFNILKPKKSVNFHLEYRSNYEIYKKKNLFIRPFLGAMITTKAAFYGYGGLAFDVFLGDKFVLTPSFAPGIYFRGGDKYLGFPLEFRSSIELAYSFKNKSRLGLMFYHISNASLGHKNPGVEALVLMYSIAI